MLEQQTIDGIIQSCIANQYMYSKIQFDNVKDTNDLLFAADQNTKALSSLLEYKLRERLEQLLAERIEDAISNGETTIRTGNAWYRIVELVAPASKVEGEV